MLPLDPEMLAGAYDYLRTTPPFRSWNLPDAEDVNFRVCRDKFRRGHYRPDRLDRHEIMISSASIGHSASLIETMAHEMIHLHQRRVGMLGRAEHNEFFKRCAARVCRFHGFDPKLFY